MMNRGAVQRLIQVAHEHDVYVSTGGWIEYVLTQVRPNGLWLEPGLHAWDRPAWARGTMGTPRQSA